MVVSTEWDVMWLSALCWMSCDCHHCVGLHVVVSRVWDDMSLSTLSVMTCGCQH